MILVHTFHTHHSRKHTANSSSLCVTSFFRTLLAFPTPSYGTSRDHKDLASIFLTLLAFPTPSYGTVPWPRSMLLAFPTLSYGTVPWPRSMLLAIPTLSYGTVPWP